MVKLTAYVPQTALEHLVAEGRVIPAQDEVARDFAVFHGGPDIDRPLDEERADRACVRIEAENP